MLGTSIYYLIFILFCIYILRYKNLEIESNTLHNSIHQNFKIFNYINIIFIITWTIVGYFILLTDKYVAICSNICYNYLAVSFIYKTLSICVRIYKSYN